MICTKSDSLFLQRRQLKALHFKVEMEGNGVKIDLYIRHLIVTKIHEVALILIRFHKQPRTSP